MVVVSIPTALAVASVGCYVIAALFRDQILLRGWLILGTVSYIAYYMVASSDGPLWDAVVGSGMILAANIVGLGGLLLSRLEATVPRRMREARAVLPDMEPGLFRRLMDVGEIEEIPSDVVLTREGRRPSALWFVIDGRLEIEKMGSRGVIAAGCFVGEIAWLRGVPASATVTLRAGARAVRWDVVRLRAAVRRSARLETALAAAIADDLSRKVQSGMPMGPVEKTA